MTHRILVTGSRKWTDKNAIYFALYDAMRLLGTEEASAVTVVHGGALGADAIAGQGAAQIGMRVEVHKADWSVGRHAGLLRNQAMVDAGANICLAFPNSPGPSCTWDCINRALLAGIPVLIMPEKEGKRA